MPEHPKPQNRTPWDDVTDKYKELVLAIRRACDPPLGHPQYREAIVAKAICLAIEGDTDGIVFAHDPRWAKKRNLYALPTPSLLAPIWTYYLEEARAALSAEN